MAAHCQTLPGTTTSATALGVKMKIDGIARRVAALPASWIAEQVSDAGQELEISSSPVKDAGFPCRRGTTASATARNVPLYFFIHHVCWVFVPWFSSLLNKNFAVKEDEANWTCASCGGCPDKCGPGGSAVVCVRCTVDEGNACSHSAHGFEKVLVMGSHSFSQSLSLSLSVSLSLSAHGLRRGSYCLRDSSSEHCFCFWPSRCR